MTLICAEGKTDGADTCGLQSRLVGLVGFLDGDFDVGERVVGFLDGDFDVGERVVGFLDGDLDVGERVVGFVGFLDGAGVTGGGGGTLLLLLLLFFAKSLLSFKESIEISKLELINKCCGGCPKPTSG